MVRPISRREALGVLGLPATASSADVTSAFRRLAKLSHPDATGRTDASAGQRFAAVVEAYRLLAPATESPDSSGSPVSGAAPPPPGEPSEHPAPQRAPERPPQRPPIRSDPSSTVRGSRPPIIAGPVVVRPYPRDRGR
jgi:hypothetical protein